jgi:alpha-tubulin suppressor-like RCC1 family protein
VCTCDKRLFTWALPASLSGEDGFSCGQLGHGNTISCRQPKEIDALHGLEVELVGCGDEFTAACTIDGEVLIWGSNQWGCLGKEWKMLLEKSQSSMQRLSPQAWATMWQRRTLGRTMRPCCGKWALFADAVQ